MSEKIEKTPNKKDKLNEEEKIFEQGLRPANIEEYIGQGQIKENLKIFLSAAQKRNEVLEHILLYGPAGLGKTTLAHVIAQELGTTIRVTSGPAIERVGDLASILTNLNDGDVFFIDEIHRLNRVIEEVLYPAMEDFVFDIVIGKGPSARTVQLQLPRFTLVGATTRAGLLSSPFRSRFGATYRLDFYTTEDTQKIVKRSSAILGVEIDNDAVNVIAARSRQTPRVANRLLKRVRDYSQVKGDGTITKPLAKKALQMLEIDDKGLERMDRKILEAIVHKFNGGPVGLHALAASVGEERDTITDVYEPYLLQAGFLSRTPKGRVATELVYKHLSLPSASSRVDRGEHQESLI